MIDRSNQQFSGLNRLFYESRLSELREKTNYSIAIPPVGLHKTVSYGKEWNGRYDCVNEKYNSTIAEKK
jgi:hypothetical protein